MLHGQVVDGVESGPVVALSDPEASDVGRQGQGEVGAAVHTALDNVEGVVLRELTVHLGKHTMRVSSGLITQNPHSAYLVVSSPRNHTVRIFCLITEYGISPLPPPSSWRDPVKLTAR